MKTQRDYDTNKMFNPVRITSFGQAAAAAGALSLWLLLALASSNKEYWETLKVFFFWPIWPMFWDLGCIWKGCADWNQGIDPLVHVSPDYIYNYPRIWLFLTKINIQEQSLVMWALALNGLFLISFVVWCGRLRLWEGILVAFLFWSPPLRLILERANADLVLILLCLATLALVGRFHHKKEWIWIAPLLMLLAALLKLYPLIILLAGIWLYPSHAKGRGWWIICFFSACIILVLDFPEIQEIVKKTPQISLATYGVNVLAERLFQDFTGAAEPTSAPVAPLYFRIISSLTFLACMLGAWFAGKYSRSTRILAAEDSKWMGFWMSTVVYVGTFMIGANFSYRLTFLMLAVPFLLQLRGLKQGEKWSFYCLVILLYIMFFPLLSSGILFVINQFFQWALAAFMIYGISAFAPRELPVLPQVYSYMQKWFMRPRKFF